MAHGLSCKSLNVKINYFNVDSSIVNLLPLLLIIQINSRRGKKQMFTKFSQPPRQHLHHTNMIGCIVAGSLWWVTNSWRRRNVTWRRSRRRSVSGACLLRITGSPHSEATSLQACMLSITCSHSEATSLQACMLRITCSPHREATSLHACMLSITGSPHSDATPLQICMLSITGSPHSKATSLQPVCYAFWNTVLSILSISINSTGFSFLMTSNNNNKVPYLDVVLLIGCKDSTIVAPSMVCCKHVVKQPKTETITSHQTLLVILQLLLLIVVLLQRQKQHSCCAMDVLTRLDTFTYYSNKYPKPSTFINLG